MFNNTTNAFFKNFGFGFLGAVAVMLACFTLGACFGDKTRWSVVEYHTDHASGVKAEYTATSAPVRHGDYLVFEDSSSHLLVRVRYAHAVVGMR